MFPQMDLKLQIKYYDHAKTQELALFLDFINFSELIQRNLITADCSQNVKRG